MTPGQFFAENLHGSFFAENLSGLFFAENLHGSIFRRKFEWYIFRRKFEWFIFGRKFAWFIFCRKFVWSIFRRKFDGSLFAENPMLVILIAWEWRRAASSSELQRKDLYEAHSRSNWEYLRNILSRNLTYIQTMYFVFWLFTAIYACEGRLYS